MWKRWNKNIDFCEFNDFQWTDLWRLRMELHKYPSKILKYCIKIQDMQNDLVTIELDSQTTGPQI